LLVKIYQSPVGPCTELRLLLNPPPAVPWGDIWTTIYAISALYLVFLAVVALSYARVILDWRTGKPDEPLLWLGLLTLLEGGLLLRFRFNASYFGYISPLAYLLCLRGYVCRKPGWAQRALNLASLFLLLVANSFSVTVLSTVERNFRYPILFQTGTMYTLDPEQAEQLSHLQGWISAVCRADERIYYSPVFPLDYLGAATGRLNASEHTAIYLHLGRGDPVPFEHNIRDIQRFQPPVLILGRFVIDDQPDALTNKDMETLNRDALAQGDYVPVLDTPTWTLYVRRDRLPHSP
jgi:hypothetical protein